MNIKNSNNSNSSNKRHLYYERVKLNKTLQKVADDLGITVPYLHYLETGKRNGTVETQRLLERYYNKDINYLYSEGEVVK